jgi:hypothetical protein
VKELQNSLSASQNSLSQNQKNLEKKNSELFGKKLKTSNFLK